MNASTSTSTIDTGASGSERRIDSAPRWRTAASVLALIVGVVMVYCPWSVLSGQAIFSGADFEQLHAFRMTFAREAIFGPAHSLPAWYPRELMGTPFRADLQNFPLIPTRLAVASRSLARAEAAGEMLVAASIRARLESYRAGRPYRADPAAGSSR